MPPAALPAGPGSRRCSGRRPVRWSSRPASRQSAPPHCWQRHLPAPPASSRRCSPPAKGKGFFFSWKILLKIVFPLFQAPLPGELRKALAKPDRSGERFNHISMLQWGSALRRAWRAGSRTVHRCPPKCQRPPAPRSWRGPPSVPYPTPAAGAPDWPER